MTVTGIWKDVEIHSYSRTFL